MEKKEFLEKVKDLTEKLKKEILAKANEFTDMGAVDFDKFENNYLLPRLFITAYLENNETFKSYYSGCFENKSYKKELNNIKRFV